MKKKRKVGKIILWVVVGILVSIIALIVIINVCVYNSRPSENNQVSGNQTETELIIDANQFSRITSEQLIEIMGQPEKTALWNLPNGTETYPATVYSYQNFHFEFIIIDNSVVCLMANSDNFTDRNADSFHYTDKASIFSMFGITSSNSMTTVVDTGFVLKYHMVSDKIAGFYVLAMDSSARTFDNVWIIYNLNYFR
ncbi:MAG: hypothetical protein UEE41_00755 [Acutalibacteraceae bacterium]|nr:hypothetical protein [Acutalibacteraceae bacterium]